MNALNDSWAKMGMDVKVVWSQLFRCPAELKLQNRLTLSWSRGYIILSHFKFYVCWLLSRQTIGFLQWNDWFIDKNYKLYFSRGAHETPVMVDDF